MQFSVGRTKAVAAAAAVLWGMLVSTSSAQEAKGVERAKVYLWPKGAPGAKGEEERDRPSITIYAPAKEKANGCAVVVCPGGGYGGLALGHEGEQIGEWLNSFGVTAFVLKYRLAPHYQHPSPLLDVQRAIRTVRTRAKEWNVDPARLGVIGFSAGGHLASTAGTHFDKGIPEAADPIDHVSSRPDFLILCYPVITFTTEWTHKGSRKNLLGENPDEALVASLSNETQVSKETPPTFLFHTSEDTGVPPQNSLLFYLALHKNGVPCEMHIYEKGRHGVGLAKDLPSVSTWPEHCRAWLEGRGLLKGEG